jgi:ketosteroid isomerase-like protein
VPSKETLERFVARVESNAHAEAIEEFYAPQASMQENMAAPRVGRDLLVAHERKVLSRAKSVRSSCVRPVFVEGDKVVIRWIFEFEYHDGRRTRMEEIAYQTWDGDKIVAETFFYDPGQLKRA